MFLDSCISGFNMYMIGPALPAGWEKVFMGRPPPVGTEDMGEQHAARG
jgi:hypothetical protein